MSNERLFFFKELNGLCEGIFAWLFLFWFIYHPEQAELSYALNTVLGFDGAQPAIYRAHLKSEPSSALIIIPRLFGVYVWGGMFYF